jgi:hypothetical protein
MNLHTCTVVEGRSRGFLFIHLFYLFKFKEALSILDH